MKRFFQLAALAAVVTLSPLAHADAPALGSNKDCNKPLSEFGFETLGRVPVYNAFRDQFNAAFVDFCKRGQHYGDMGYQAAIARFQVEAARWMRDNFADDIQPAETRMMLQYMLENAGMNGYTGFDNPPAPTQAQRDAAAEKKNAAMKAAAGKAATAEKAQK